MASPLRDSRRSSKLTDFAPIAICRIWESRCSARSGADVRAREKRHRIQRESWETSLLSRRQVTSTICCSNKSLNYMTYSQLTCNAAMVTAERQQPRIRDSRRQKPTVSGGISAEHDISQYSEDGWVTCWLAFLNSVLLA